MTRKAAHRVGNRVKGMATQTIGAFVVLAGAGKCRTVANTALDDIFVNDRLPAAINGKSLGIYHWGLAGGIEIEQRIPVVRDP